MSEELLEQKQTNLNDNKLLKVELITPRWVNVLLIVLSSVFFILCYLDIVKVYEGIYTSYFDIFNAENINALIKLSGTLLFIVCFWDILDSSLLLLNCKWSRNVYTKISKNLRLATGILSVVLLALQVAFYHEYFLVVGLVLFGFALINFCFKLYSFIATYEDCQLNNEIKEQNKLKKQQLMAEKEQKRLLKEQEKLNRKAEKQERINIINQKPYNRRKGLAIFSSIFSIITFGVCIISMALWRDTWELDGELFDNQSIILHPILKPFLIALLIVIALYFTINCLLIYIDKNKTNLDIKKLNVIISSFLLVLLIIYSVFVPVNAHGLPGAEILYIASITFTLTLCIISFVDHHKSKKQLLG